MIWLLVIFSIISCGSGLDNGLALTPPMGWMHWQRFRCLVDCDNYPDECVHERLFRAMADRLVDDGYLDAGYEYVIIDDCWMAHQRDSEGRLQPNATRFPSGIKSLADYIHGKGLKLGIYADYGTKTCAGYPGSLDYLEIDAKTFAEWEVDYLKLDACYFKGKNYQKGYEEIGKHLNETGRPIVFSCSWPAYEEPLGIQSNYTALVETCNLWRNWDDIADTWTNVTEILEWFSTNQDRIANYSGPGHWNDPDMLVIGNFGLSYEQSKAQMAIWAIMAAPLIMSVDLRTVERRDRDILLNRDVIAINQDPLGIQGRLAMTVNKRTDVWVKPILPKTDEEGPSYAVGILNDNFGGYPSIVTVKLSDLNITQANEYVVKDIFEAKDSYIINKDNKLTVRVKPTGVVLLTLTPVIVNKL